DIGLPRVEPGSRDVEVSPRYFIINKPLDELCSGDRSAPPTATCVFHVGEFGVDHLVILGGERHAPDQLPRFKPGLEETIGELIVIRKHARILLTERNDNSTGESSEIDHELRLESLGGIPDDVGQHEAAF